MSVGGAANLKQRLERARHQQQAREGSAGREASGVQPVDRAARQPLLTVDDAAPVRPTTAVVADPSPVVARSVWQRVARGVWLVTGGALLGIAVVHWGVPDREPTIPARRTPRPSLRMVPTTLQGVVVHQTELITDPAGAEVVSRGAVIANTPARVPRPAYEALYLLRRSGYYPQLVRVSPQAGEAIIVRLRRLDEDWPALEVPVAGSRTDPQPDPVGRSRGNDVGRESAIERSDGPSAGRRPR